MDLTKTQATLLWMKTWRNPISCEYGCHWALWCEFCLDCSKWHHERDARPIPVSSELGEGSLQYPRKTVGLQALGCKPSCAQRQGQCSWSCSFASLFWLFRLGMAKESPPWMWLLAAELGCCCRVFISCKASSLRAEMVYEALMLSGLGLFLWTSLKLKEEQEDPPEMAFQLV